MPLFEDLVKRALAAQARARPRRREAEQVEGLARTLREAHAGRTLLLHCAWCGKIEVDGEWLRLEGIGRKQARIAKQLFSQSTHGICPDCFERVSDEVEAHRSLRHKPCPNG